jgi:hypothetical protein
MRHGRFIPSSPARVYAALRTADFGRSPLVRLLFAVRAVPAILRHPVRALAQRGSRGREIPRTLPGLTERGFGVVGERSGDEVVLGVVGRFWKASGELRPADREQFRAGPPAGEALVAWNFRVVAAAGGSRLTTETRIVADPAVLATFRRYWFVVRPGSGLIRRSMLRAVARASRS